MSSHRSDTRSSSMTRGKVVKPILRKFTQSEKNSIDLDRPAAEQEGLGIFDFSTRSANDVSFVHANRRGYHNRSTSGTSQFSTATSGSGQRTGSFVHPFQQTPRPYTPPHGANKSYQGSLRENEQSIYTPALTEDDEPSSRIHHHNSNANGSFRAEPLARVSTTTSTSNNNALRIQTKQYPSSFSRLARESHTSLSSTLMLSPEFSTPTETMSPTSAIRSSIDDLGMRLRSRSDVHYNGAETIEEARRRWDLEQKQKDEKYAREEVRKLEKQNKAQAKDRIGAGHHRRSSASEAAARSKRSKSDLTIHQEKTGFLAHEYTQAQTDVPPVIGDRVNVPQRVQTTSSGHHAKKKANSTFQVVLMWFRTRILRMKKKTAS